jgi:hypothetical protein
MFRTGHTGRQASDIFCPGIASDEIALHHTTLIKEGTFQSQVLQTPEGVESGLVPPPDH